MRWETERPVTAVSLLIVADASVSSTRGPSPSGRAAANARSTASRRSNGNRSTSPGGSDGLRVQVELRTWYDAPSRPLRRYSALSQRSTLLNAVLELPGMPSLLL